MRKTKTKKGTWGGTKKCPIRGRNEGCTREGHSKSSKD